MYSNYLFDLDQTLLDFHASEHIALEKVIKANGLSYSDDIYVSFKEYNKYLWLELEKSKITREELYTLRFNDIISRCGGNGRALDPLKINNEFIRTMSVNGVPMEGALEFVKKVKEDLTNSRIYIVSNGATINAKGRIASTGLDKYIDGIFISEDMGVTKPSIDFFDMVLNSIGASKKSCIVIGDSLSSDMQGAKNAGLDSVWFMPTGDVDSAVKEYEINYTASSFDGLFKVLKNWSAECIKR